MSRNKLFRTDFDRWRDGSASVGVADSGTESPLATSSCEANAAFVVSSTLFELFFTHVSLPLLLFGYLGFLTQ